MIERTKFRAAHSIPKGKRIIGVVGRLEREKGLEFLEKMVTSLEDEILFLQFPGWKVEDADWELKRTMYLDNANRIRARNPSAVRLYCDETPKYPDRPIRNFDVLLTPSLSEVQPMVVLEALTSGVPVVATNCTKAYAAIRKRGFKNELKLIQLPKQFSGGDNPSAEFGKGEIEYRVKRLLAAVRELPISLDNSRAHLAARAASAGFTDSKMYSEYLKVYELALGHSKSAGASMARRSRLRRLSGESSE